MWMPHKNKPINIYYEFIQYKLEMEGEVYEGGYYFFQWRGYYS